jgi:hypothetical protein
LGSAIPWIAKRKHTLLSVFVFFGDPYGNLACATIPDKQSTGLFGAKAQIAKAIFSLIRFPWDKKIRAPCLVLYFFGDPYGFLPLYKGKANFSLRGVCRPTLVDRTHLGSAIPWIAKRKHTLLSVFLFFGEL